MNVLVQNLLAKWWPTVARARSKPSPWQQWIGRLVLLLFASFGLFNIYTWASVGTVFCFRKARYGGAGWVTYSEAPTPFVIWATLYSIPLLIPIILLAGHVLTRRQHRRMAFRQMVDGGGPAPIKRSIDQR